MDIDLSNIELIAGLIVYFVLRDLAPILHRTFQNGGKPITVAGQVSQNRELIAKLSEKIGVLTERGDHTIHSFGAFVDEERAAHQRILDEIERKC
jgi:hypothetical protein